MAVPWEHMDRAIHTATAIVDVRTPGEFAKGAVARAVNIPLFSNGERAEIGTLYKQLGKEPAVRTGLAFAGEKLSAFTRAFEAYRDDELLIYCARGGMRSAAVASLLASIGYRVNRLEGGYKAFRNYLLRAWPERTPPHLLVLHGRTGVGKTRLLARLPNALDLEALARHRSSVFGAVNLSPRTQQWFESLLLEELGGLDLEKPVWVEGESRKVGSVFLPAELNGAMRAATCVLATASLKTRIARIVEEYGGRDGETLSQLEAALRSLTGFFGKKRVEGFVAAVRASDLPAVVEPLLVEYYDPRYEHAMQNYRYALTVSCEDLAGAADALTAFWRDRQTPH